MRPSRSARRWVFFPNYRGSTGRGVAYSKADHRDLYFTALAVTRHSDRFAAGVELFGITNWESFMGQSDIPFELAMVHWDLTLHGFRAVARPVCHSFPFFPA